RGTHRQLEVPRITLEVVGHLVLGRKRVLRSGERQAVERIQPRRREEAQRVPARAPRVADARVRVEDQEAYALALEVIADRQAGLAGADHDHVEALGRVAVESAESFEGGAGFYDEVVHGVPP